MREEHAADFIVALASELGQVGKLREVAHLGRWTTRAPDGTSAFKRWDDHRLWPLKQIFITKQQHTRAFDKQTLHYKTSDAAVYPLKLRLQQPDTRALAPPSTMLALIVQSAAAFHATTRPGVCGRAGAAVMQQKDEAGSMRTRPLGASGIMVSELGLGTQRWGGTDFNSPDEKTCHAMLDLATEAGVNLVDTAESYPIPSGRGKNAEGATEAILGSWMAKDKARREKLVIASKITGGGNVTPRNLERDLEGTLKRLGTDYLDVYLLHWPARYTPQANWGQSLEYGHMQGEVSQSGTTSFTEIAEAMGSLVKVTLTLTLTPTPTLTLILTLTLTSSRLARSEDGACVTTTPTD